MQEEKLPEGNTVHKRLKKKLVKKFDEEPDLEILNGPYGTYIAYKKKNYKIPKGTDAQALSLDDCKKIIEEAATTTKKPRRPKRS